MVIVPILVAILPIVAPIEAIVLTVAADILSRGEPVLEIIATSSRIGRALRGTIPIETRSISQARE